MFGGMTEDDKLAADVWAWNGTAWEQVNVEDGPFLTHAGIAFDAQIGRTLVHGGMSSQDGSLLTAVSAELWEWNGTGWYLHGTNGPSPRSNQSAAWDVAREKLVVFGGSTQVGTAADTWEWTRGTQEKAGHQFSVKLDAAGYVRMPAVKQVQVNWVGGGTGYPAGMRSDGVQLLVWSDGRWQTVSQGNGSVEVPEEIAWTIGTVEGAGALPTGPQRTLHVALSPLAANGLSNGLTGVSTDYVEMRVRLQLPGQEETFCHDFLDDDGDGAADCLDTDCADEESCELNGETSCGDGLDNDGDGYVDCEDLECECGCEPVCDGRECGGDGCGGFCGTCPGQHACMNGQCECQPLCKEDGCGPDGCDGSCGECEEGHECQDGLCECVDESCSSGCGGVTLIGCCQDNVAYWCDGGALNYYTCDGNPSCGWDPQWTYYFCGTDGGSDPQGEHLKECDLP